MNFKPEQQNASKAQAQRWVVMGVCGCGKTEIGRSLASRLAIPFIEGDQYHPQTNIVKMRTGIPLTDTDRAGWLLQLKEQIGLARSMEQGLVLSCSALKRAYRDVLRSADPTLKFIHLYGERELIAARMQSRSDHFMPLSLLDSQLADLQPLEIDEAGIRLHVALTPEQLIAEVIASASS